MLSVREFITKPKSNQAFHSSHLIQFNSVRFNFTELSSSMVSIHSYVQSNNASQNNARQSLSLSLNRPLGFSKNLDFHCVFIVFVQLSWFRSSRSTDWRFPLSRVSFSSFFVSWRLMLAPWGSLFGSPDTLLTPTCSLSVSMGALWTLQDAPKALQRRSGDAQRTLETAARSKNLFWDGLLLDKLFRDGDPLEKHSKKLLLDVFSGRLNCFGTSKSLFLLTLD